MLLTLALVALAETPLGLHLQRTLWLWSQRWQFLTCQSVLRPVPVSGRQLFFPYQERKGQFLSLTWAPRTYRINWKRRLIVMSKMSLWLHNLKKCPGTYDYMNQVAFLNVLFPNIPLSFLPTCVTKQNSAHELLPNKKRKPVRRVYVKEESIHVGLWRRV